jgi:hypothetical protein
MIHHGDVVTRGRNNNSGRSGPGRRRAPRRRLPALAALCLLAMAGQAAAAYQQLPGGEGVWGGTLGAVPPPVFPEEVQLGGVGGMAVNYTGNGGVEAGTVYAATRFEGATRVAVYEPDDAVGPGEEERLRFVESWVVESTPGPYERCGPLVATSCAVQVEAPQRAVDVDVDQATGDVYVLSTASLSVGNDAVTVYQADGSAEVTRFGKLAPPGKTTAETPAEIHESPSPGGIAVGPGGVVYVFDRNVPDNSQHRLMTFREKTPGDPTEYEYVVGGDVGSGFLGQGNSPAMPVADAAGHVYIAAVGANYIEEYDPTTPAAPPVCSFEFPQGGITAITVDPLGEEPFFFSEKKVGGKKRVHHLSKCSGGKFSEVETIEVTPERADLYALAFDPVREVSPTRPPGVLYGGAPGGVPAVGPGQPGQSSLGYFFARAEEVAPAIGAESVSAVTGSSAQLQATIDPENFPTRYAFQYLTQARWEANEAGDRFAGAAEAPPGGAPLGEGEQPIAAAAAITGLAPDTTYHWRAVATNCAEGVEEEACESQGADQTFRTPAPSGAPGRAFELVSPPQKNGGQALPADTRLGHGTCGGTECKPGNGYVRFPMVSSADGDAVAYEGTPFFAGSGAAVENQYLAPRDPASGWHTSNLTPQLLNSKNGGGYKAFSPSLSTSLLQQTTVALTTQAPLQFSNLYIEQDTDPFSLAALLVAPPPNREPGLGPQQLVLSYAGASSDLSQVFFTANDALTGETAVAPPAAGGPEGKVDLYEWSAAAGLRLVNVGPTNTETLPGSEFGDQNIVSHAISTDGRVAYWSDPTGRLYARIDAAETVEVDDPGHFLTASADGSEVLLDDGCLYDLAEEECEDLTEDEGGVHQGGFAGLVGQGEDLSHLYFVDTAVLTTVPNGEGQEAQAGKPNLYGFEADGPGEGTTSFIATLAAADGATWATSPSGRNAEGSPSGRFLAFMSQAPLAGPSLCGTPAATCQRVFLFDSQTAGLYCASCNQTGAAALGLSELRQIEGATSAMPQARYLTDTGRLYFDSRDSLAAADTNGGAEDVYEFAPTGVAGCTREEGCPTLISGGREDTDSNLVTIDPQGENVFFTTRERLVAADSDELVDLYDAREGGGIPDESVPHPLPCLGEACQGPPPPAPEPPLGSQLPGSEGSAKPKCKKGQVRKNGKCVKKNQGKKKKGGAESRGHRR